MIVQAYENHGTDSRIKEIDVSPTVTARWGTGGNNVPLAMQGNLIGRDKGGPNGVGVSDSNTMYTLTKTDVHAVAQHYTFPADMNFPCSFTPNVSNTLYVMEQCQFQLIWQFAGLQKLNVNDYKDFQTITLTFVKTALVEQDIKH